MIIKEKYELRLLAGIPIEVEGVCNVHAPKLKDIALIGEDTYHFYLQLCTSNPNKLIDKNSPLYAEYEKLSTYEFLLLHSTYSYLNGNTDEINILANALSFFLKEKVDFLIDEKEAPFFYLEKDNGETIKITIDKYEEIKQIIKVQNGLEEKEVAEFNPKNKKAQEIANKLKKAREKIKKMKKNDSEDITLADLISIFSSYYKSKINLLNVWDLDIYQFNDQFQRMKINEEYEISIQSLLHGADPNEVRVKNFFTKIK